MYRVGFDGKWEDLTKLDGVIGDAHVHAGRAVFVRQSLTEPPEVWAMPIARVQKVRISESKQSREQKIVPLRLTNHNESFRNRDLGRTQVIRWKNPKDGLEIEGLLTLPVGYVSGRVPLLTFVHGGPASRFDQGFLGYLGHVYAPQVLAANGFAVLRPNPRGTGGYRAPFREANRNDWGGMDRIDINAGIDVTIAPDPPTPFPPDSFDVVVTISIFTHFDELAQRKWLMELHRLLRPGGLLIASTHGPHLTVNRPDMTSLEHDQLRNRGFVFRKGFGAFNDDSAFHTREYLESEWSSFFALLLFQPQGLVGYQDLSIWRK